MAPFFSNLGKVISVWTLTSLIGLKGFTSLTLPAIHLWKSLCVHRPCTISHEVSGPNFYKFVHNGSLNSPNVQTSISRKIQVA